MINAVPLLAAAGGEYEISRSVRLRSSASAYFNRTPASAGNGTTWTFSCWVKRGAFSTSSYLPILSSGSASYNVWFGFGNLSNSGGGYSGDYLCFSAGNGSTQYQFQTLAVFRDPSAWYHIVLKYDSSNATAANRVNLYVNGVLQAWDSSTTVSQNFTTDWTSANQKTISSNKATAGTFLDGYITEINSIDGQALTPSSFGETDSITGVWKPKKYTGTYGTNGFYLNFSDNSNNTAATIGKDYSGNGNNWTPNNISVTSGVTYDSMLDVPTPYADGGNGRGNYAVLNPIYIIPSNTQPTFSNGNLTQTQVGGEGVNVCVSVATIPFPTTGKYYCEVTFTTAATSNAYRTRFGVQAQSQINNSMSQNTSTTQCYDYSANGNKGNNNAETSYGNTYTSGDTIGMAVDLDNGKIWWSKNGTWQASGDPANGTNAAYTGLSGSNNYFASVGWFATSDINFGQRPFAYTPPSGFKALNTQNLPEPTIKKGNQYFDATTYTGNGSTQSIVNSGAMQPDLVWVKTRSATSYHQLIDSVRGVSTVLNSNYTGAESSYPGYSVTAFNSNGFTVVDNAAASYGVNGSTGSPTYVGWQWKESATAGFDIVTGTSTGTSGTLTLAHSLGVAPSMVIAKNRDVADDWYSWHKDLGASSGGNTIRLNTTAAKFTSSNIWGTGHTSSNVLFGQTNWFTASNQKLLAYVFAEVAGFSNFGSYTGNGSTDGPFVFCGFRPAFVMVKRTDTTGNWCVFDNRRLGYNGTSASKELYPNLSNSEGTSNGPDQLSNGFKLRDTYSDVNASGGTYIYAAFSETAFKFSLAR